MVPPVTAEVKWLKHYSSVQDILTVGDGHFSFSLALATAFGSGENLVATSLDSYMAMLIKHNQAGSNVAELKRMGAKVLHGVDAKNMKRHTYLKMKQFDRIVFNFPHAGFQGQESEMRFLEGELHMINSHKELVRGFFHNARQLLRPGGEIHVSHKTGQPYDSWDMERAAMESSLVMFEKAGFHKGDDPGYRHKRGDGAKCNRSFRLRTFNVACTFKFRVVDSDPETESGDDSHPETESGDDSDPETESGDDDGADPSLSVDSSNHHHRSDRGCSTVAVLIVLLFIASSTGLWP